MLFQLKEQKYEQKFTTKTMVTKRKQLNNISLPNKVTHDNTHTLSTAYNQDIPLQ